MTVLDGLPEPERAEVEGFAKGVATRFSDSVREVILFGSAARGELGRDSDIDILAVVERRDRKLLDQLWELATDIWLEHERVISLKVLDAAYVAEMERLEMPFIVNVRREGITLWKRR